VNAVEGRLIGSTFVGDQFHYRVSVGDQVLQGKSRLQPASELRLSIDPAEIMVFPERST